MEVDVEVEAGKVRSAAGTDCAMCKRKIQRYYHSSSWI
jgi:hypothetical protein